MTFQDLLDELQKFTPEQLSCIVEVQLASDDTIYYPAVIFYDSNDGDYPFIVANDEDV